MAGRNINLDGLAHPSERSLIVWGASSCLHAVGVKPRTLGSERK